MLRIVAAKPSQIEHVQFAAVNPPARMSANIERLHFEMTRPSMTVSESCRPVMPTIQRNPENTNRAGIGAPVIDQSYPK
jgi:hypothetical protein